MTYKDKQNTYNKSGVNSKKQQIHAWSARGKPKYTNLHRRIKTETGSYVEQI